MLYDLRAAWDDPKERVGFLSAARSNLVKVDGPKL